MRIVSIGFFASEYHIALANALAETNEVVLFLTRQNLAVRFPKDSDLENMLFSKKLINSKIKLRLINYPNGQYAKKAGMALGLIRAVREIKPDVIHYQSGGDPWGVLALLWLRHFPLVVTIHDAKRHLGDGISDLYLDTTNAIVSHLANQIIVHGQQQANILSKTNHVQQEKITVLPIGSLYLNDGRARETVSQNKRLVLFFGRLRAYKGVEVLIRAAPEIAAQIPGVCFVIAGSGDCPELKQAAKEYPGLFEIHNRFIEAEEVPALFQRAALVVQPYIDASQSGVLPLAYQFGRPVVATRVGSIPEVVEDGKTGYLVEPKNVHALVNAVVRLLRDDALREEMGKAALIKLNRDLSWDAIAEKTLVVYEEARSIENKKNESGLRFSDKNIRRQNNE